MIERMEETIAAHGKNVVLMINDVPTSEQIRLKDQLLTLDCTVKIMHFNEIESSIEMWADSIVGYDDHSVAHLYVAWATLFLIGASPPPDRGMANNTFELNSDNVFEAIVEPPIDVNKSRNHYENILKNHWPRLEPRLSEIFTIYAGPVIGENHIVTVSHRELIALITEAFANGYKKVVFMNMAESIYPDSLNACHRIVRHFSDHPFGTFYYCTAMLDAKERYEIYCKKHNIFPSLYMLSHMHFETVIKHSYSGNFPEPTYDITVKPKKFLCFNKLARIHRVMLMAELYKADLVKDSYCSFYLDKESWSRSTARQLEVMSQEQINIIDEHLDDIPLLLNRTKERDNPVTIVADDLKYFKNSYVSLVTETIFYTNGESMGEHGTIPMSQGAFISEKLFKPIICKHPFIVLGPPNTLQFMRKFGYKTFPTIINEAYDVEEDNNKRFQMVVDEINRLAAYTDDEWLEFQEKAKETLDHNFKRLWDDKDLSTSPDYMDYFRK